MLKLSVSKARSEEKSAMMDVTETTLVCVCVCVFVCMYVCLCVCACVYMCVCRLQGCVDGRTSRRALCRMLRHSECRQAA